MKTTPAEYSRMIRQASPRSPLAKDCLWAFLVGGAICLLGEGLRQWYLACGLAKEDAGMLTSGTLVLLSALATGLGWVIIVAFQLTVFYLDRKGISPRPVPPVS